MSLRPTNCSISRHAVCYILDHKSSYCGYNITLSFADCARDWRSREAGHVRKW